MAGFKPGASPPPVKTPTRFVLAMSDRNIFLSEEVYRLTGPSTRESGPVSTARPPLPSASQAFANRLRSIDAVVRARLRIQQLRACIDPSAFVLAALWTCVARRRSTQHVH